MQIPFCQDYHTSDITHNKAAILPTIEHVYVNVTFPLHPASEQHTNDVSEISADQRLASRQSDLGDAGGGE